MKQYENVMEMKCLGIEDKSKMKIKKTDNETERERKLRH